MFKIAKTKSLSGNIKFNSDQCKSGAN